MFETRRKCRFRFSKTSLGFSAELGGAPEDWVRVSGEPIIGAGRIDIYRPATWGQPADSYIAVGMALTWNLAEWRYLVVRLMQLFIYAGVSLRRSAKAYAACIYRASKFLSWNSSCCLLCYAFNSDNKGLS